VPSRRLFAVDPRLGVAAGAPGLLAELDVEVVELGTGQFEPAAHAERDGLGLLVCEGIVARRVEVPGGSGVELLAPGQLLQPWAADPPSFATVSWSVVDDASLAVIDGAATAAIATDQPLLVEMLNRGIRRAHALTVNSAIESIVGVENRVLLALWQLAEQCGTLGPDGVTMPVQLTHELLAELVGSRRPSVTTALASLSDRGLVVRRGDRTWLLHGTPPAP
jgi:hypothetical protein